MLDPISNILHSVKYSHRNAKLLYIEYYIKINQFLVRNSNNVYTLDTIAVHYSGEWKSVIQLNYYYTRKIFQSRCNVLRLNFFTKIKINLKSFSAQSPSYTPKNENPYYTPKTPHISQNSKSSRTSLRTSLSSRSSPPRLLSFISAAVSLYTPASFPERKRSAHHPTDLPTSTLYQSCALAIIVLNFVPIG